MTKTYLVFIIQSYDEYDKVADIMHNMVMLEVIAINEKEAMARAKKLINKNGYRLSKIIEKQHGT